jgi:hypothetical protein
MDKKKKIIIGVLVGVFVVCPLVGYLSAKMFVLPPSTNKVCTKMLELTEKSLTDSGMSQEDAKKMVEEELGTVDECVKDEDKKRSNSTKGIMEFRKEYKCILDSETLDEAAKC